MIEACFFDLDKTVIDEQGRLYSGLSDAIGSEHRNFAMTILTARGYPRFREAVAENPALTVTPGMPVALENGARIVDSSTFEDLHYHPLSDEERIMICEYIDNSEPFRYVAFHPKTPRSKTLLWSPDPAEAARLHAAYSYNAEVFTSTQARLFQAMHAQKPCMVTCRTYGGEPTDLPSAVQFYAQGSTVNFVPRGVDKGVAAQIIADMTNLALSNVLAAGNDHNDLPVLQLQGLGCPVAVGPEMTPEMLASLPEHAVHVADPTNLGAFIVGKMNQS